MRDVTIVIPNFNGISVLNTCLDACLKQRGVKAEIIVVDNGSTDGSQELVREQYPACRLLCLDQNYGFPKAVNEGIRAASSEYVILLNNDTQAEPDFAAELLSAIRRRKRCFSCQACMIQYHNRAVLDSAGDFYCALGWAIAEGNGQFVEKYQKNRRIFSACAGAAIYRKSLVEKLGGFDEAHFAYLEDMDLSYRARLYGYENRYEPKARVYHMGSATSGSKHNSFKVNQAACNNLYLIYKNMPPLQILINLPFLVVGCFVKYLFFVRMGLGSDYRKGFLRGIKLCKEGRERKVSLPKSQWKRYLRIQLELWANLLRIRG